MAVEYFISVMGADRPGRLAHVGQRIERLGGSILDLSQTVMRGCFTVLLLARFDHALAAAALRDGLLEGAADLAVGVQPAGSGPPAEPAGQRLILTARGADRTGLLAAVGSFLAGREVNVEDMYARADPESGVVMILQVRCPPQRDLRELQLDLAELAADYGLTAHLQHENVFLATGEIGSVRALTL